MKKYFVYMKQRGTGCDYTIGCGMVGKIFDAEDEFELYKVIVKWYGFSFIEEMEEMQWTELKNMKKFDVVEYNTYLKLKEKFEGE